MNDFFELVFGSGTNLDTVQMASRAVVVFFVALLMIRLSGRRSFGQHSPFDACISVLLGAILSRAVVGASPFGATMGAAFAVVAMHRAVAWISIRRPEIDLLVSGAERLLVAEGRKDAG